MSVARPAATWQCHWRRAITRVATRRAPFEAKGDYITTVHKEPMEEKRADINLILAVVGLGLQIGLSIDRLGEKLVEAAKIVSDSLR